MTTFQGRDVMASLHVKLLGGFEALDGSGAEPGPLGRKAQATLAVLALNPGTAQSRERLIALLWSDRGESQARGSLRHTLTELRKAFAGLDPPPLITDRETVCIDPSAVEVDTVTFERLLEEDTDEALAKAAGLYRGDLLDGFDVRDAAFDEWLRPERERFRERAVAALSQLVERKTGDEAIALARRLMLLDPLIEATHRTLMRLYVEAGNRRLALKQYEACRRMLRDELGVEPEPDTEQLHDRIRAGGARRVAVEVAEPPSTQESRPFFDMSGDKTVPVTGGCLCGEVRYQISGPAVESLFCHCRMCQKFTGGTVVASSSHPTETVRFTKGAPKYYKSSPLGERGFCANCGSGLTFRPLFPPWSDWINVLVAGFDDPEPHAPTYHLGVESQMPWLDVHDELPRIRCAEAPDVVEAWAFYDLPVP
jgi:DNA-binding SARP family transcriptional activator